LTDYNDTDIEYKLYGVFIYLQDRLYVFFLFTGLQLLLEVKWTGC